MVFAAKFIITETLNKQYTESHLEASNTEVITQE